MSGRTMEQRVGDLEKLAQTLAPLPGTVAELGDRVAGVEVRLGTVESQIVQLRTEMADGFSATKTELRGEMVEMKTELREDIAALGRETAAGFLRVDVDMRGLHSKLDRLLESPRRRRR